MRSDNLRALARNVAALVCSALAGYAVFILVLARIHHRPTTNESLPVEGRSGSPGRWPDRLNLLTWNLGCADMGEEADFFMEGGHDVLAKDRATVVKHIRRGPKSLPFDAVTKDPIPNSSSRPDLLLLAFGAPRCREGRYHVPGGAAHSGRTGGSGLHQPREEER